MKLQSKLSENENPSIHNLQQEMNMPKKYLYSSFFLSAISLEYFWLSKKPFKWLNEPSKIKSLPASR
jgi:hypothetical protein